MFVVAEHFESHRDINYHASKIKNICSRLDWPKDSEGRYSSLIDSAANQKTLNGVRSVAELFLERGIKVDTHVNKDLFSGISQVKSYIKNAEGVPRLFIFSSCTNLIRELKSYFWGEGDSPVKRDDHCLDELRYYLMSRPKAHLPPKNKIEQHKEFLIRKKNKRRALV